MKISSQEEYGLRCLVQVARETGGGPLPISEIAMSEGLSVEYVGKLLMKLRKGGLVDSVRGKAGGYVLARPAEDITLKLVLDVLSEPIYDPGYCERFSGTEETCVHVDECGIRPIWSIVNRFLANALDGVTIADLIESEILAKKRLKASIQEQAGLL
jgi:Rrf2 family protein